MKKIINIKIKHILQTKPKSQGIMIEEFGEAYSIELIAQLEDGSYIKVNEYDYELFTGDTSTLIRAELINDDFSINQIEGEKIVSTQNLENEFSICLENGLCFLCEGGPGGNYPVIYKDEKEKY
jgi:hypothetical protein